MSSDSTAGMVGRLLSFRLEGGSARRGATQRVLEGRAGGLARSLSETLEPGEAITAVLVEHTWAQALGDATGRIGGAQLSSEFVEPAEINEVWAQLPPDLVARRPAQD